MAVIGGAYSGVTLAAAPVYNGGKHPLVQLSPSASSPVLSTAGDYTFQLCPSDLAYGAALARFASGMGLKRAAVLYVNDGYGRRGIRRTFLDEYLRAGGTVMEVDPFLASAPNVSAYLTRIVQAQQAHIIILASNQEEGLPVLWQMDGVFVSSAYIVGASGSVNRTSSPAIGKPTPMPARPIKGRPRATTQFIFSRGRWARPGAIAPGCASICPSARRLT